jgi:6,7-dimethyl-8-ribityllumazine synthase
MSGSGAPQVRVDGTGMRVAVVSASWHDEVMVGQAGVDLVDWVRVPGSFELPVACARLARDARYDALVALGVVVRGGTPHFDYVCQAATQGLTDVTVSTGIPIGFGVLTCDDEQQALDRAGLEGSREDKGHEAATAALATALVLRGY